LRLYSKSQKNNEIYLSIKYIKSLIWGVAERLSYIEDTWRLKVKESLDKTEFDCVTYIFKKNK
jgi:hypothetical protein